MLVPSTSSSSSSLYDSERKKRKKNKEETIAGKIVELIPYTIEHVSTLVDLLVSTTSTSSKGSSSSTESTTTASTVLRLVVVDTNVLLHHMDVLEYLRDNDFADDDDSACGTKGGSNRHHAIANAIVIPQTALEECRHRSLVMYRRATDLVRSSSSSTSNSTTVGGNRQRRCVIVFADVHHVDTQIKSFPPESRLPASSLSSNENDDELAASSTAINDENDARLRKVAWFYGRALHDFYHSQEGGGDQHHHQHQQEQRKKVEVVFLSDDAQSRKLALREQPRDSSSSSSSGKGTKDNGLYYKARSVREHVTLLQKEDPTLNLLDLVANFNAGTGGGGGGGGIAKTSEEGGGGTQGGYNYTPHVASSTLSHGLRTNRYYQGIYRSNRDSYTEGYVTIRRGEDRVAVVVSGREDVNRAVDGDIVAVELFAVDHWLSTTAAAATTTTTATATATGGSVEANDGGSGATGRIQNETSSADEEGKPTSGIAADTAEPSVRDIENIAEEVPVDEEGRMRRPVGKGK